MSTCIPPGLSQCTMDFDGRLRPSSAPTPTPTPTPTPEVTPAPAPEPWPAEPKVLWIGPSPVGWIWRDADGQRWLVHKYGDEVVTLDGDPCPGLVKERIGEPAGWREAAGRLPRDCTCVTHSGPHWLAYDLNWRETNAKLLWPGLSLAGFAAEEPLRLRELAHAMQRNEVADLRILLAGGAA